MHTMRRNKNGYRVCSEETVPGQYSTCINGSESSCGSLCSCTSPMWRIHRTSQLSVMCFHGPAAAGGVRLDPDIWRPWQPSYVSNISRRLDVPGTMRAGVRSPTVHAAAAADLFSLSAATYACDRAARPLARPRAHRRINRSALCVRRSASVRDNLDTSLHLDRHSRTAASHFYRPR